MADISDGFLNAPPPLKNPTEVSLVKADMAVGIFNQPANSSAKSTFKRQFSTKTLSMQVKGMELRTCNTACSNKIYAIEKKHI